MPLRAVVDSSMLREAAKRVKDIDPEIRKGFIKDLKSDLKPYADKIVADIPRKGAPPLSGMANLGRLRWGGARASIHVTPSGGRGSLARIEIYGPGDTKGGFKMVDLAGTSDYVETNQGDEMIYNLRRVSRCLLMARVAVLLGLGL
jgi:hypothetical protein